MFTNDEHLHDRRLGPRTPHGGWTALQWREGAVVLHWLQTEQRLHKGFDALAIALRATLDELVQTASDARAVWHAAPAVLCHCNDPQTYSIPQAETAYAWLHMLDRYVRTWLALEHLVRSRLLPMGRFGVRSLDIGTGPGPSAFATHDFFAALEDYSRATKTCHWNQPPEVTCVERDMNRIRHLVAERLAIAGAPRSVLAMTGGIHDFGDLSPPRERKQLENNLRNQYDEYFNEARGEWDADPVYTAKEANREANSHHRYRLFTFSNFLATVDMVSTFQDNIEEILTDAGAGSVLLMIGATDGCYPEIRERIAKLAQVGRFRRHSAPVRVTSKCTELKQRLREEVRSFYCRLKRLAGDLPNNGPVGATLRSELEGDRPMGFGTSTVLAFRK
ncbi:MAG: hypothetical protein F4213_16035 [Boseongicola sp. SB0677_bin_26]|nr:hypothetical protein [Boseongicola sp. SB0677_bin_26]